MSNPPTIDMIIAGTWMRAQCARSIGRAVSFTISKHDPPSLTCSCRFRLTNAHDNQEAGTKASKIYHRVSRALHEIIWVGASATYPVRYRREHIGRDDQQREEVVEQRGGQDDKEESNGENLGYMSVHTFARDCDAVVIRRRAQ